MSSAFDLQEFSQMVIHHTVFLGLIRSHLCLVAELCRHLYFLASVFFSSADGMTKKKPSLFSPVPGAPRRQTLLGSLACVAPTGCGHHMVCVTAADLMH